jgi:prepilin-type N-terminal cleavage/methylation domain-containing protein
MLQREAAVKGFTLIEVLIAMAILAITCASIAALMDISGATVRDARIDMAETLAAQSKMAELRADATTFFGGSIAANQPGYFDFVAPDGAFAGAGAQPRSAAYLRRWSVSAAPLDPANTRVLQVVTTRVGRPGAREVYLISLLTRVLR